MKNILKATALLMLVVCSTVSWAQPGKYTSKNKKAIKAYEEGVSAYDQYNHLLAQAHLEDAISKDEFFIEAYILLSQVFSETDQPLKAIDALETSVKIDENFFPNSFYFLGEMYLSEAMYNEALEDFQKFLSFNLPDDMTQQRARLGAESCYFALNALQNPVRFNPVNVGPEINTAQPEYFPCSTADNETMLFTRLIQNKSAFQGKHEDFFVSNKVDGKWSDAYNVTEVNTLFNEGAPTLAPDGQILIFTACELDGSYGDNRNGKGSCDLFYSQRVGYRWSDPQNLGEKVNSYYWESQPSFSADGKTLYFVRGKYTRNGIAQQDIYMSQLSREGEWSKATKIKGEVNTPFEEESVMIHPDGKSLYFSSNGHPGMGGMDIYVSRLQENGEWGKPHNLGYPVNTSKNENSILVGADGEVAYMASNRDGGYGDMDIYSFTLPVDAQATQVTYMKGKVIDSKSFKPLEARFELFDLETGELVAENYSNMRTGEFLVCLPSEREYALNVSKEGYLFHSENFSLKGS